MRYAGIADANGVLRLDLDGDRFDEDGEIFIDILTLLQVAFVNGMDISLSGVSEVLLQDNIQLSDTSANTVTFTAPEVTDPVESPGVVHPSPYSSVGSLTFLAGSTVTATSATYDTNVNFGAGVVLTGFHQFNRSISSSTGILGLDSRLVFNGYVAEDITFNATLATDYVLFNGQFDGNVFNNGPTALDVFVGTTGLVGGGLLPVQFAGTGGINLTVNGSIIGSFAMGSNDDKLVLSSSLATFGTGHLVGTGAGDDAFEFYSGTWDSSHTLFMDTGEDTALIAAGSEFLGGLAMGREDDLVTVEGSLGSTTTKATVNLGSHSTSKDVFNATGVDVYADVFFIGNGEFNLTNATHTGNLTSGDWAMTVNMVNSTQFVGGTITLGNGSDTVNITNSYANGGVNTGGGTDFVTVRDSNGFNTGDLGGGSDRLTLENSTGAVFDLGDQNDTADLNNASGTIDLGSGNDFIFVGENSGGNVTGGEGVDTFVFDGAGADMTINDWEAGEAIQIWNLVNDGAILRAYVDGDFQGIVGTGSMRGNGNRMAIDVQFQVYSDSIEVSFVNSTTGFAIGPEFGGIAMTIEGDVGSFDIDAISFLSVQFV